MNVIIIKIGIKNHENESEVAHVIKVIKKSEFDYVNFVKLS